MTSLPVVVVDGATTADDGRADAWPHGGRRDRRVATLVGAVTTSSVGDGMVLVAFPLLALRWTGSALAVALVAVAARAPGMVLALPAGVLVDRVDRRRLVTVANAVRTAVLVVLALSAATGAGRVAVLYLTVGVLGVAEVLVDVAVQSVVPELVARDRMAATVGMMSSADVGGESMAGAALGGLLVPVAAWLPVVGDAASFVVATLLARAALPPGRTVPAPTPGARAELRAGLTLYRRSPLLRSVAGLVGVLAACSTAVMAVLVVFAGRRLGLGATGYGLLVAGAAVGQVAGHLLAGRVWKRVGPGVALLGAGALAACCYLALASTRQVAVALGVLVVESLAVGVGDSAAAAVRQLATPAGMAGRSAAAYRSVVLALVPLGALGGGLVAATAGSPAAIGAAGALQLVVVVLVARRLLRVVADVR
ncbi:MAG TPA: MFS transporter [Acidimicrobiales bacterium]|nr:MFS transporter [Acidimicrobiales bacterium]